MKYEVLDPRMSMSSLASIPGLDQLTQEQEQEQQEQDGQQQDLSKEDRNQSTAMLQQQQQQQQQRRRSKTTTSRRNSSNSCSGDSKKKRNSATSLFTTTSASSSSSTRRSSYMQFSIATIGSSFNKSNSIDADDNNNNNNSSSSDNNNIDNNNCYLVDGDCHVVHMEETNPFACPTSPSETEELSETEEEPSEESASSFLETLSFMTPPPTSTASLSRHTSDGILHHRTQRLPSRLEYPDMSVLTPSIRSASHPDYSTRVLSLQESIRTKLQLQNKVTCTPRDDDVDDDSDDDEQKQQQKSSEESDNPCQQLMDQLDKKKFDKYGPSPLIKKHEKVKMESKNNNNNNNSNNNNHDDDDDSRKKRKGRSSRSRSRSRTRSHRHHRSKSKEKSKSRKRSKTPTKKDKQHISHNTSSNNNNNNNSVRLGLIRSPRRREHAINKIAKFQQHQVNDDENTNKKERIILSLLVDMVEEAEQRELEKKLRQHEAKKKSLQELFAKTKREQEKNSTVHSRDETERTDNRSIDSTIAMSYAILNNNPVVSDDLAQSGHRPAMMPELPFTNDIDDAQDSSLTLYGAPLSNNNENSEFATPKIPRRSLSPPSTPLSPTKSALAPPKRALSPTKRDASPPKRPLSPLRHTQSVQSPCRTRSFEKDTTSNASTKVARPPRMRGRAKTSYGNYFPMAPSRSRSISPKRSRVVQSYRRNSTEKGNNKNSSPLVLRQEFLDATYGEQPQHDQPSQNEIAAKIEQTKAASKEIQFHPLVHTPKLPPRPALDSSAHSAGSKSSVGQIISSKPPIQPRRLSHCRPPLPNPTSSATCDVYISKELASSSASKNNYSNNGNTRGRSLAKAPSQRSFSHSPGRSGDFGTKSHDNNNWSVNMAKLPITPDGFRRSFSVKTTATCHTLQRTPLQRFTTG